MGADAEEIKKENNNKQSDQDSRRKNYASFEQEIARQIYDRKDVREAGQTALSKVSQLLIRYNRLKDAENRRTEYVRETEEAARERYDRVMEKLAKKREEAEAFQDESERVAALNKIDDEKKKAEETYQTSLAQAKVDGEAAFQTDMRFSRIDNDEEGGILSTLMLGGSSEGSKGYSLTTGDIGDLMKGGEYIRDVSGDKGTLFEQMALMDNAVNSGGIKLSGKERNTDAWMGSSLKGASANLNDILHNITESDLENMNSGSGERLDMNLQAINSARADEKLDTMIGGTQKKVSMDTALEQRGVTAEMVSRKRVETGGVNDLDDKKKKEYASYARPQSMLRTGFFSRFRKGPEFAGTKEEEEGLSRQEKKRRAMRQARVSWQQQMANAQMRQKPALSLNQDDNAENAFQQFAGNRNEALEQLGDAGFLRTVERTGQENAGQTQNEDVIKDLPKDKSARNMLAAYRLMGASQEELFKFRLALIAYMVPSGKKTIYEILKESEEAGVKGNEDLSDPESMYATFLEEGFRMDKTAPEKMADRENALDLRFGKEKQEKVQTAGLTSIEEVSEEEEESPEEEELPNRGDDQTEVTLEEFADEENSEQENSNKEAADLEGSEIDQKESEQEEQIVLDDLESAQITEQKLEELEEQVEQKQDLKQELDEKQNQEQLKQDQEEVKQLEQKQEAITEDLKQTGKEQEPVNDLQAANDGAKAVNGLTFEPVQRKRTNWRTKLKNRFWRGLKMVAGVIALPFTAAVAGISKIYQAATVDKKMRGAQANRRENRPEIKGRDNNLLPTERPKDSSGEETVYDNVQNVPLVWERVTAGDPEQQPELSIMVDQAKAGSDIGREGGEMGHTMVGLAYSRMNKLTGRKERYALQYGFYPKGGFIGSNQTVAMAGGALMPGMLLDDYGHPYTISRTYAVDAKKVNDVLRASEQYPDGGYGYYKRNCTTFVVDMAKTAGLSIGSELIEDEMRFDTKSDAAINISNAFQYGGRYIVGSMLESKLQRNDVSYANFGQKMATLEDRDRYYNTAQVFSGSKEGYSPGAVGEQLRAEQDNGQLGASFGESSSRDTIQNIYEDVMMMQARLYERIYGTDGFIPPEQQVEEDVQFGEKLLITQAWMDFQKIPDRDPLTTDSIRNTHKELSDWRRQMNAYYQGRLNQSAALNEDFMNIFNKIELGLMGMNQLYNKRLKNDYIGDLKDARALFENEEMDIDYTVTVDGKDQTYEIKNITPSIYEAYLQIYGSADQAIKKIAEYQYVRKQYLSAQTKEDRQAVAGRFRSLDRINDTALDFAASHRYRLNKTEYDEKDMQYAFVDLPNMEKTPEGGALAGEMFIRYQTASSMYQSQILEPVFTGIMDWQMEGSNSTEIAQSLSDRLTFLAERPDSRTRLKQILSFYIGTQGNNADAETVWTSFLEQLQNSYLAQTIGMRDDVEIIKVLCRYIREASSFRTLILGMITELMNARRQMQAPA